MHISDVVFICALAFLLGVAAASFGWPIILVVAITLALLVVFLIFSRKLYLYTGNFGAWTGPWKYAAFFSFAALFGTFYYNFYLNLRDARANITFNENISFEGVISNEPRRFEKYQIFDLELSEPMRGKTVVLAPPMHDINYGDHLKIKGIIQPPENRADKPVIFFPQMEVAESGHGFWLKEKLLDFKKNLLDQFDAHLPPDKSALLGGITLGSRSGFSEELRDAMAASGTTHLVALSGYNITILVMTIAYIFGSFLSRRKTFYATAAIVAAFVLMVGGEPSVIRAAVMGFIVLLAGEIGRVYSVRNAIALTAAVMILINPTSLASDAGFQLSFASLLGIVYLSPVLKHIFKIRGEGFLSWKENVALTASAQMMVLPIVAWTFGGFSLTSIIANVLVLGFIPLTMFLGFALAALSSVYFYLGFFAAKLAGMLLAYEIWIMEVFGKISVPVDAPGSALIFAALYYSTIAIFIYGFSKNNHAKGYESR